MSSHDPHHKRDHKPRVPVEDVENDEARAAEGTAQSRRVRRISECLFVTKRPPSRLPTNPAAQVVSTLRELSSTSGTPKIPAKQAADNRIRAVIRDVTKAKVGYAIQLFKSSIGSAKPVLDSLREAVKGKEAKEAMRKMIGIFGRQKPLKAKAKVKKKRKWTLPFPDDMVTRRVVIDDSTAIQAIKPVSADSGKVAERPAPPPKIVERHAKRRIKEIRAKSPGYAAWCKKDHKKKQQAFSKVVARHAQLLARRMQHVASRKAKEIFKDKSKSERFGGLVGAANLVLGPTATIIGTGGASAAERQRLVDPSLSPEVRSEITVNYLEAFWPADESFIPPAYRKQHVKHFVVGAAFSEGLTDHGVLKGAMLAMSARGINPLKHRWILVKHTDKEGRTDYHLLVACAGVDGVWGMPKAYDSHIGAMMQNITTSFAGLGKTHQTEVPWGPSIAAFKACEMFAKDRCDKGHKLHATIFGYDGKIKEIPIQGERAMHRWAAALDGEWLSQHDAMLIWTLPRKKKNQIESDDWTSDRTKSLVDYATQSKMAQKARKASAA